MKTYILLISLFFVSILSINDTYAQKQDSLKQRQAQFYKKVLPTSKDTANQIVAIMDTYKEGVKKVISEGMLSEATKRAKIDELIADKNKKLEQLLTPAQQAKIIPTTERKKNKSSK